MTFEYMILRWWRLYFHQMSKPSISVHYKLGGWTCCHGYCRSRHLIVMCGDGSIMVMTMHQIIVAGGCSTNSYRNQHQPTNRQGIDEGDLQSIQQHCEQLFHEKFIDGQQQSHWIRQTCQWDRAEATRLVLERRRLAVTIDDVQTGYGTFAVESYDTIRSCGDGVGMARNGAILVFGSDPVLF